MKEEYQGDVTFSINSFLNITEIYKILHKNNYPVIPESRKIKYGYMIRVTRDYNKNILIYQWRRRKYK